MKILSIDVGIKNLAFCLFEKSENSDYFKITKWDTVNISEQHEIQNCIFIDKIGLCNKPAKFKKDDQCFCLKHSKKQNYQIPTSELKPSFINKQKIQKLFEIADKYSIKYPPKIKKVDLVTSINDYIKQNYLQEIEVKKAADVDLYNIGMNIKAHFDKLFSEEVCIDSVIIENQISPIATRMKTIQGMLVQYFVMCPVNVKNVEFISASNKLKDCDIKDKSKYSDRKKLGIAKCLEKITTDYRFSDKLDYFNSHKKKDDLADSFLQGLWFISNLSTFSTKL
jgi:hypothetical protein